jgi:hypothetical protein
MTIVSVGDGWKGAQELVSVDGVAGSYNSGRIHTKIPPRGLITIHSNITELTTWTGTITVDLQWSWNGENWIDADDAIIAAGAQAAYKTATFDTETLGTAPYWRFQLVSSATESVKFMKMGMIWREVA